MSQICVPASHPCLDHGAMAGMVQLDQSWPYAPGPCAEYCCPASENMDSVAAAYLVDPVDNTKQTPESPSCPSAIKALNASGLPVGISGAGVVGSCNPVGSNGQVL